MQPLDIHFTPFDLGLPDGRTVHVRMIRTSDEAATLIQYGNEK